VLLRWVLLLRRCAANGSQAGADAASSFRRAVRFQSVEFLTRFEADRLPGGNADLGARAGIAANACFAGADAENSESAQFYALSGGESLLETLEYRIHRGFRLGSRQACTLDYMMDDVLLNQWSDLFGPT